MMTMRLMPEQKHWTDLKARIFDHALGKGVNACIRHIEHASESVLGAGVPKFMGEGASAIPHPEPSANAHEPWKAKPSFKHKRPQEAVTPQGETSALAVIMETLRQDSASRASSVTMPREQVLENLYRRLAYPQIVAGPGKTIRVGAFSISALDAATAYNAKLVIYPGPYDEEAHKSKWIWWKWDAAGSGHWEANAWVLRPDGSSERATDISVDLTIGQSISGWRAGAARGHGYWADVEWGSNLPPQRSGPGASLASAMPTSANSLMAFVASGKAASAVSQGSDVTNTSRTFLVGNRPYLIITRIAAAVVAGIKGAKSSGDDPFADESGSAFRSRLFGG